MNDSNSEVINCILGWVGYAMSSVDDVGERVTKHVENVYWPFNLISIQ